MRTTIKYYLFGLTLFFFHFNVESQNYCKSNRFVDKEFFGENKIAIDTNINYGIATDWLGVKDTQLFNIAYPKINIDSLQRRPFIMLMHGGGFHEEDDYNNRNQWNSVCFMLAKRGFVAATIDYRVGWKDPDKEWNPKGKLDPNPTGSVYAAYRAYQDARAALRYFVHNASVYGIDTGAIFIGGRSAGGDITLTTSFLSQKNIDSLLSKLKIDCHKNLGSLDSSTTPLTDKYKIRGAIDMWGPIADTAFIDPSEARSIPIIMFHGTDDKSVPYKKFCPPDYPYTRYGAFFIAARYKHLGGCYQLNTKLGGGHGEDFDKKFLTEHISSFVKSVLCNNCKSEEFESEIPFKTKLAKIFSLTAIVNTSVVVLVILLFTLTIRFIRRRRRDRVK